MEAVALTSNSRTFLDGYRGVRALVTGHTGFKGSWLSAWLLQLGAELSGYALEPVGGTQSLFSRLRLSESMDSITGDIRDPGLVAEAIAATSPQIVFHLAAQPLVRRSYQEPVETFATNVMGTVNVLEACRTTPGVRAIVVITSDKAYTNPGTGEPIVESSRMGGRDPYSASKAAAELVTTAYRHSFMSTDGAPLIASARAGNVIGGGDESEDRLIPDIVRAIRADAPVVIRNPTSTRPWQHVLEPLRGYLMLGDRLLKGERQFADGWNFGPEPGDAIPVKALAEQFVATWGDGDLRVEPELQGPHEEHLLSLDISKAARELGFRPALTIRSAIDYSVSAYRDLVTDRRSAREILNEQISDYEALLT